jgi:dipeptidyl aminopeptidase/acylaminoacyl peptidase
MKTGFAGALALAVALSLPAAAGQPPVEAFGTLPALSEPQLSPDGHHIAVIQPVDGRPAAIVYPVNLPGAKPILIPSSTWLIEGVQWARNDRLLLLMGENVVGNWTEDRWLRHWGRTVAISTDGTNPIELFQGKRFAQENVDTTYVVDIGLGVAGDDIYMPFLVFDENSADADIVNNRFDPNHKGYGRYDLYRVSLSTGKGEKVEAGSGDTVDWFMDGHGKIVGRLDRVMNPLEDRLKRYANRSWSDAGTFDATADRGADVWGLSEDGKSLIRISRDPSGMNILVGRDFATGTETPLFSNSEYDVDGAIFDPWTRRIVGATYADDRQQYHYFDSSRQNLQEGLEAAFPNTSVTAVSFDLAREMVIAAVDAPRQPTTYYIVNRTNHQATFFGSAYPGLQPSDLGEMKPYGYTARDGLSIPAYITLPPGRVARNLPAVVMPHGGPDARDTIGFDWWAQFLANRGYVVLQPNYRGSFGYGQKFTDAGLHQWGLKSQDDISDGVKKMIADGIVDPKRICIVGASYGGYAALAGAAFSPDLYKCAVSVAGVSDLPHMLHWEEVKSLHQMSKSVSFWISRIGNRDSDATRLDATSPAKHADLVKCPILLMHGDTDTTVPFEQSQIMYDALTAAHKPVEFVKLEGDDHYLELSATRIRMLSEIERFLRTHIGS